ncbi:(d)CMP kinase [Tautonia sociabilis]|uniref:Cytidylate kinase n=1 Tax=Tautonia sociabilis TaxID=2080755 RepID=A0A432MNJ2_9BACT|nr:(d)CMP kinase [Tautonia sociabilis]RUL88819.1 (d)CMP kinase [Tautonia sociabilis]
MRRVVTIDGPAGSGKSTVARIVADRLGWRLLDTGAMYRAVALAALRAGLDLADEKAVGALADRLTVSLPPGRVLLDHDDVTAAIRTVEVTRVTRFAADNPAVRRRLAAWQRAFAAENDTITEGRDQGTVVFPDASCKFFLTADPVERARRRHAEFLSRGESIPLAEVLRDQEERDARDASRAIAPLRPAEDATVIDTTGRTIDEVAAIIEAAARSCRSPEPPAP